MHERRVRARDIVAGIGVAENGKAAAACLLRNAGAFVVSPLPCRRCKSPWGTGAQLLHRSRYLVRLRAMLYYVRYCEERRSHLLRSRAKMPGRA